ncbi:MAG: hypothetical protein GC146_00555 [Limimaricola sp.]|nr:hypothetical protein [Limimaricola sp.]
MEYMFTFPSADVSDTVKAGIGNYDWKIPGIKAMALAMGMAEGTVQQHLTWLRTRGLLEGYLVQLVGPAQAYYRVIDYIAAWEFINVHVEKVKKLKSI